MRIHMSIYFATEASDIVTRDQRQRRYYHIITLHVACSVIDDRTGFVSADCIETGAVAVAAVCFHVLCVTSSETG